LVCGGNPNPYTDLDEIFYAYPHLSKEGFIGGLTPAWGLETVKAEEQIFKMLSRLQINLGSAEYLS